MCLWAENVPFRNDKGGVKDSGCPCDLGQPPDKAGERFDNLSRLLSISDFCIYFKRPLEESVGSQDVFWPVFQAAPLRKVFLGDTNYDPSPKCFHLTSLTPWLPGFPFYNSLPACPTPIFPCHIISNSTSQPCLHLACHKPASYLSHFPSIWDQA